MFFEKLFSLSIIIILLPILFLISFIIYLSDGFTIIYKQDRIGLNGKVFKIFKFRTMKNNTPLLSTNEFINYSNYLIKGGSFIRRYSLDEIPNIFNIMLGDLSFIGYRPALKTQKILNKKRMQLGILNNKPGITGLAQISGRDSLNDLQKIDYELKYISEKSFILKMRILFLTFLMLVKPNNIKA